MADDLSMASCKAGEGMKRRGESILADSRKSEPFSRTIRVGRRRYMGCLMTSDDEDDDMQTARMSDDDDDSCDSDLSDYEMSCDLLTAGRELSSFVVFLRTAHANKPSTSCVRTACPKLSTSLEQAINRYNNLVNIIRLVAMLFQQFRYSHDITILLQPCC